MPQATIEEDETVQISSGSGTTSKPTGPGTLRQRFKLSVNDLSKEVEELSVKLKRKACHPPSMMDVLLLYGFADMLRGMDITRSVNVT